jgi:hypothetical protein
LPERVIGAEVDGDAGEGTEQAVDGEDDEGGRERSRRRRGGRPREQRGIERRLHGRGAGPGPVGRAEAVAGGEGAGDPAHLPAEGLVELVGVGQVAIGKADQDQADVSVKALGVVFGVVCHGDGSAVLLEDGGVKDAELLADEGNRGCEDAQTVLGASPEVDGRGFFEVLRWAGDFTDGEAEHDSLGDHLVIEDEVIRIFNQRQRF